MPRHPTITSAPTHQYEIRTTSCVRMNTTTVVAVNETATNSSTDLRTAIRRD